MFREASRLQLIGPVGTGESKKKNHYFYNQNLNY
jgi:hypothetical protein